MRTYLAEHEADGPTASDGDVSTSRLERRLAETVLCVRARVHRNARLREVSQQILFPAQPAVVVVVPVPGVLRVVAFAKLVVGHGEHGCVERLVVGLVFGFDVAGAPARVDEFPGPAVDADGVPGVAGGVGRREGGVGGECGVADSWDRFVSEIFTGMVI